MLDEETVLDFEDLSESLASQGAKLKGALMSLLGLKDYFRIFPIPARIRGTASQINSFRSAASGEKKYLNAIKKHGLDNPHTFASRYRLDLAVRNFERETGLKWPMK
jgi:hypothetical protein